MLEQTLLLAIVDIYVQVCAVIHELESIRPVQFQHQLHSMHMKYAEICLTGWGSSLVLCTYYSCAYCPRRFSS